MKSAKKARLEAAGWKVASAEDFLGLSRTEAVYVEMKLALARKLRERRQRRRLSQTQVAKVLGSSQSRVAKMEAADPSVSADLLIRSLLTLGSTRREVATTIGRLKVKTVA
jgi:predicted transcriptional regulator